MIPLHPTPMHGCAVIGRTRVGALVSCYSRYTAPLRLRTKDGRVIRFRTPRVSPLEWDSVAVSPNGRWLLLQASLGCDTRGSFVVPVTGGTLLPVPRPRPGCDDASGFALGWTRDNLALVRFEPYGCSCSLRAGVYEISPADRAIRARRRLA